MSILGKGCAVKHARQHDLSVLSGKADWDSLLLQNRQGQFPTDKERP